MQMIFDELHLISVWIQNIWVFLLANNLWVWHYRITGETYWWEAIVVNTLGPRQNGRHFADDILKCILMNENVWIPIEISLKFVPKGSINNNPALFQIMAWRRPGDKPLSEPMLVSSLTHICVTRPQWVKECLQLGSIQMVQWFASFKRLFSFAFSGSQETF